MPSNGPSNGLYSSRFAPTHEDRNGSGGASNPTSNGFTVAQYVPLLTPTTPSTNGMPATGNGASAIVSVPQRRLPNDDLRLTPMYLIKNASKASNFSIDTLLLQYTGVDTTFSIDILAGGIAQHCSVSALRQYLSAFPRTQVEEVIKGLVNETHPVLFYAAERNCVDCVKLLIEFGCEGNVSDIFDVPCIAFAVMRTKFTLLNPSEVVKILVAFGANPRSIPEDMWAEYLETPSAKVPHPTSDDIPEDLFATTWCTEHHRKLLAATLDLSTRYFLYKASQLKQPRKRAIQIAKAHNCSGLLKLPYLIIGQTYATSTVAAGVLSHIGGNEQAQLVLTFAGLSGHGKTELAKHIGSMLSVPMTVVDCAQMRDDFGLFGSPMGYQGSAQGSQLNNHLAAHSGQRSVVFMDEFDKTTKEVYNSLLLVLDSGEHHDRRTNKPVDASKTIWIMATNLGDRKIEQFYRTHVEDMDYADVDVKEYKGLADQIRSLFAEQFGAPMAGRLKKIAPFLPFSEDERAVIVHKFLMKLVEELREPIDLTPTIKRYLGHVHLSIKNDGQVCRHLAESYVQELGSRSLTGAIDDIRSEFFSSYVDTDELVDEVMNDGPLTKYTVQLLPVSSEDDMDGEVVVMKDGFVDEPTDEYDDDENDETSITAKMGKASLHETNGGLGPTY